jgi:hypothetical protein
LIYFLSRPSDGLIKIGRTHCLRSRLSQLAREHGPGLTVLGIVSEDRHIEAELHRRFQFGWYEGEWFRPGAELLDFIAHNAREWTIADDLVPVRLPSLLVEQARAVAEMEGLPLADVIASILGPALAIRECEARARRAEAVGLE